MERLPKLPLSMTAVAVVTPSSASNSAVMVGADTCPSLFFVASASCRSATPLTASCRLRPGRPVLDRSPRESFPAGIDTCPGATTEDRPSRDASGGGPVLPVRRVPHEEGDRPRDVPGAAPSTYLAAQAQSLDERAVPGDVGLRQVVQQATTTSDQQEQAPPAVVVVLVHLEVLGEVADPTGQHRDLHLGRARVVLDRGVLGHDLLLERALERHGCLRGGSRVAPGLNHGGSLHTHVGHPTQVQGYMPRIRRVSETSFAMASSRASTSGKAIIGRSRSTNSTPTCSP